MDQADGQSVKLSNNIIFGSWMGDPMLSDCLLGTWVIDLIFFLLFLYTEFRNLIFLKISVPSFGVSIET